MYLIRLDDACEYMDVKKWQKVEDILDVYKITPLVGIIPKCKDTDFTEIYKKDEKFWAKAQKWQAKNWIIGMHGYEHVFCSNSAGINPVHHRSEFAGLPLEQQEIKIEKSYQILKACNMNPNVFFAPAHTFDLNTLKALENKTPIRIISDTIANNVYKQNNFYFLPQQSGKCRNLPFKFTTIALHPNSMKESDFLALKEFLQSKICIKSFFDIQLLESKKSFYDKFLTRLYFFMRYSKKIIRSIR